jgi:hypothetical protein
MSFNRGKRKGLVMRALAVALAAILIMAVAATAAWKEYPQPQLGFVVEFPADPLASNGTYKTTLVPSAVSHIYAVKDEQAVYAASVVDLLDRKEEGATLLGEAESMMRQLGDVTSVSASRVEPGRAAVFGRFMTISCRSSHVPDLLGTTAESVRAWLKNSTGVDCPDGSRLVINLFFHRGRLYLIQGINLPGEDVSSPAALRFANSISFFAADGSRNFADTFR